MYEGNPTNNEHTSQSGLGLLIKHLLGSKPVNPCSFSLAFVLFAVTWVLYKNMGLNAARESPTFCRESPAPIVEATAKRY